MSAEFDIIIHLQVACSSDLENVQLFKAAF